KPHVKETSRRRPQRLADVDTFSLATHVMKTEHVHFGLDRKRQTCDILAAPLLVDLEELGDLGGHCIRRLRRTADGADTVPELTLFDPSRFPKVDQLNPLAAQEADVLIPDLEGFPASTTLTESPEDRHWHRESEVLVLGDPAFMGKVQVGQWQGVNRYASCLAVGRITSMLRDVPFERIDPEGSDACRIVSPHVIPGYVECAPVGIEPVAGDELPEGNHIAPSQVEGLRTGLPGDTSPRRGNDPAVVDPVTRQVTLHGQNCESVGLAVTGENRVDELVAAPEYLLFFALNLPRVFLA